MVDTLNTLLILIFCHLVGDYVLQSNFLATTKGENWYHLFVHCVLYCLPFFIIFGMTWQLIYIFITHLIVDFSSSPLIDSMKARYNKISYLTDQICHYIVMLVYLP